MPSSYFDEFIDNALKEDIGDEDHTSRACIPRNAIGKAQLLVKEEGVLARGKCCPSDFPINLIQL